MLLRCNARVIEQYPTRRDVADEARREFALALSDHLTLLKAYDGWRLSRGCGSRAEREYIRDHFLSRQTLVMVEEMRRQFRSLLRDIGFIESELLLLLLLLLHACCMLPAQE